MSTERELRKEIKRHLQAPDWSITPVESGGTVSGVPDNFWAHKPSQTSGWLELKCTSGWTVDLRPHQISWMTRHTAAGVRCVIAVRQGGRDRGAGADRDTLWLLSATEARRWAAEGLPANADAPALVGVLGRFYGGPKRWAWGEIGAVLTG